MGVTSNFNRCTQKAYQDYRTAMGAGDDGRPDFAARKACNYLQDSVEDCGNILLGECNTADKVAEIKDNQIRGTLKNLETSIHHWDSEKCPAVQASINRMKESLRWSTCHQAPKMCTKQPMLAQARPEGSSSPVSYLSSPSFLHSSKTEYLPEKNSSFVSGVFGCSKY